MKKKAKIFIIFTLILAMFLGFTEIPKKADAAISLTSEQVADYFNSQVGKSYPSGYCLKFVADSFAALGAERSSTCCAYRYGSSHIVSTSISDIPVGADVYFGKCGGGPCSCGASYYGHVGVYVGDGYFVHATGGKVQKSLLTGSNWKNKYRGWGWHGNVNVVSNSSAEECGCQESYAGIYTVTTSSLSLIIRSGHSTKSSKITSIPKGEAVTVTKADGTWAHVEWNGYSGYCSMKYLTKQEQETFTELSDGYYVMRSALDENYVTDVYGVSMEDNANVQLYELNCGLNQGVYIQAAGNGYYKIFAAHSWKLYEVFQAETACGSNVVVGSEDGSDNQLWKIIKNSDGTYSFMNKYSCLFLDVEGGNVYNENNIWAYTGNGTDAQKFYLSPARVD